MKFENIVVEVPNYTTISLDRELKRCGEQGFKLVNVVMAKKQVRNRSHVFVFCERGGVNERD